MSRQVIIDCFPASAARYARSHVIVAVDVIRATTTMVTAVANGWRCFPAASLDDAAALAAEMPDALLAGELGGNKPDGFELTNTPAGMAAMAGNKRRFILLSTSGTELLCRAVTARAAFAACFRNVSATAASIAAAHERVAIIGAGSRNQFREEDQMCCAWIAERLLASGFNAANETTLEIVDRWHGLPVEASMSSASVDYLRRTRQHEDLEFVFSHIDDIDRAFALEGRELVEAANTAVLPDVEGILR